MKTGYCTLNFNGYWRESEVHLVPSESGIYCVYGCLFFPERKTIGINELLYVGESENVGDSLINHGDKQTWLKYLGQRYSGEIPCYSFAPLNESECKISRKRIVEILIHEHKPKLMDVATDFSTEYTPFNTKGHNAKLHHYYDPLF